MFFLFLLFLTSVSFGKTAKGDHPNALHFEIIGKQKGKIHIKPYFKKRMSVFVNGVELAASSFQRKYFKDMWVRPDDLKHLSRIKANLKEEKK
jgi:hypothetical protein